MATKEVWKDIPNYEGYYQASNLGRVKSLDRTIFDKNGHKRFYKGSIIGGCINDRGYKVTTLGKNGVRGDFKLSQLIAITFLNHTPNGSNLVVDHINGNQLDDSVKNLRIVTQRENVSTCFRSNESKFSSTYPGVVFDKSRDKWQARIFINGKNKYLGRFKTEEEAYEARQKALKEYNL